MGAVIIAHVLFCFFFWERKSGLENSWEVIIIHQDTLENMGNAHAQRVGVGVFFFISLGNILYTQPCFACVDSWDQKRVVWKVPPISMNLINL